MGTSHRQNQILETAKMSAPCNISSRSAAENANKEGQQGKNDCSAVVVQTYGNSILHKSDMQQKVVHAKPCDKRSGPC